MPDFSSEHNAPANPGPQRDYAHIWYAAGSPQPLFAQRGHVGVVFEDDARPQPPLNFGAHGIFFPSRKIGRLAQRSGLHVNDSRNPNAGAKKITFRFVLCREALDGIAHFVDHVIAAEGNFRPECNFLQKLPLTADSGNPQVGATEIDSDGKIRHDEKD